MEPTTSSKKNMLILGASYAGLSTTHYLLKHVLPALPEPSQYQILLVSASSQTMCRPACPRALLSDDLFDQGKLFVNTAQQLEQYAQENVKFVFGKATNLDHENRTATIQHSDGKEQVVPFHTLVVATGASTPSPLLGLNTTSSDLRNAWSLFRPALPTAKRIVIAGAGPAGVEVAGELGQYLNGSPGWFGSGKSKVKVEVTLIASGDRILSALRPSIARTAESYLSTLGVTIVKNAHVERVEPETAGRNTTNLTSPTTVTLSNGQILEADLYIPATGARPNTSFLTASLLQDDGRVITNPGTLRVDSAGLRIYAIGDCSSTPTHPSIHQITNAVPILCSNIKHDLLLDAGAPALSERKFEEDLRETQLVPIGTQKGVGAAMGWRLPSWMVWAIKGRDYWLWTTGRLWSGAQWAKEG
jgi:NADH dehydrogenase FAD-containing subunit